MATASTRRELNKFVKGLITEATELTFPVDAAVDILNFDLDSKGVIQRREGIDFEDDYVFIDESGPTVGTETVNTFLWTNVSGDASLNVLVAQIDKDLVFYTATDTVSDQKLTVAQNLTTYKLSTSSNADVANNRCSFSSGNGKLYVVHPHLDMLVITYNSSTSISIAQFTVRVRDFDGEALVSPFDDLEHQPIVSEMTNEHWYNLANQGWANRFTEMTSVVSNRGTYPSNTEQWQFGKSVNGTTGIESFNYDHYVMQEFGNARAPQGHIIYDAFDKSVTVNIGKVGAATPSNASTATQFRVTSTAHGLVNGNTVKFDSVVFSFDNGGGCGAPIVFDPRLLGNVIVTVIDANTFHVPATLTAFVTWCLSTPPTNWSQVATSAFTNPVLLRPKCNAFFQGRHVQAGVEADGFGSNIYISKILVGANTDPGRCYQDGDPTSEYTNDIVDSDGLVLNIQSMDDCVALIEYSSGFLALATNGIWYISGGGGAPFTTTNWTINKLESLTVTNDRAIVIVEGVPIIWADEGIYQITQKDLNTLPNASNLIEDSIQTFYDDLGHAKQATARGAYNDEERKVIWIYEGDTAGVLDQMLMFNVKYNSFWPSAFDKTEFQILDVVTVPEFTTRPSQKLKFMTIDKSGGGNNNFISYSDLSNRDHLDWFTHDTTGVDSAGYIETGHDVGESPAFEMQAKYITMFMRRTEDVYITDGAGGAILDNQSGCLLQVKWDWTDHANAGKWSIQRQVYKFKRVYTGNGVGSNFDNGYPVTVTKNRIKGSGRSLRLRFDTESGKKCEILGWSSNLEERNTE